MPPTSYAPQLRPLSVGEILDAGFRLLRYRFGTLILCVLVPVVPLTIVATILQASTDENAFDLNTTTTSDSGASVVGALLGALLQGAAVGLAIAACIKVISAAYLGDRAEVGDSLRYGFSRILALIGTYILIILILIPCFIALIIPGIYMAVKLSVAFTAVVVERAGPGQSISRSFNLTRGNWWRVFGVVVVVFLIEAVLNFAIGSVLVPRGADRRERAHRRGADHDPEHHHLRDHVSALGVRAHGRSTTTCACATRASTSSCWRRAWAPTHRASRPRRSAPTPRRRGPIAPPSSGGGFAPPEGPATSS